MLVICPSNQVLLAFIHCSAHSVEKGLPNGQENENDMVVQSHFSFMRKQVLSYNESDRNDFLQDLAI